MATTFVSPTDQVSQDEQHVAQTLAHLFIAGVVAAKAADWTGLARKWSDHGFNAGEFNAEVTRKFTDVFWQSAGSILVRAAGIGRQQALMDFTVQFPKKDWDQMALNWSQVYGHEMAKQSAGQSTKAVSNLVPWLLNKGVKGDALALQVRGLYGLDPRSMNGAINFLSRDVKPRNQTLIDLSTQLLSGRAKIIGDVQSFTALNFGRQLTYMEAQDAGLLPKSARKVWVTAIDERVCPVCRPMDGRSVGLTDFFHVAKTRIMVPPVHPNCRCTTVPEEVYQNGIITRTARFSDDVKHKAKLVSEIEDLLVEKFSQDQPRDDDGRWVPKEVVRDHLLLNKPKALLPIPIKPAKTGLSRYHKGVDNRLKRLPTGTYELPRSYLEAHARGWGLRVGQESHVKQLTHTISQEGFDRKKPITLYVFNDAAFLRDGAHRLEAAYRLDIKKVPVRVVRIKRDYEPFHRGVGGYLNERKTERIRRQVARREKYTKPITIDPKPWDDTVTRINRHMIERGQVSH